MAPARLVVLIKKQAGECMTPSPPEGRIWSWKRPAPCVCTCCARSKHFIEEMNFETRQRCGTCPPPKQNKTRFACQRWEHLFALMTFKFSAKITHTPGKLTPGDFHLDRSGGHHVVPR